MGLPPAIVGFINGMLLLVAMTRDQVSIAMRMKKLGLKSTGGGGGAVMPGTGR
jgi:hypothetical protein